MLQRQPLRSRLAANITVVASLLLMTSGCGTTGAGSGYNATTNPNQLNEAIVAEKPMKNVVIAHSCTNITTYTPSTCVNNEKVCKRTREHTHDYLPISSGEYISQINQACQEEDMKFERPICGEPLPGL